jgi:hypothetical protein
MPGFNWNDQTDPLEGYESSPEPVQQAPAVPTPKPSGPFQRPAAPAIPKPATFDLGTPDISGRGAPLKVNPEALAKAMADFEEESSGVDTDKLTEAEWRLEKAQFYRAVINSQLLSSDHPAAVEVEKELQSWAVEQMEILLGIRAVDGVNNNKFASKLAELEDRFLRTPTLKTFSPDEEAALKAVAARVLGSKPAPQPVQQAPAPSPVPAIVPQATQASPRAQTAIKPVQTPPRVQTSTSRRPAGRPRVNPCKICNQMECDHKANQTKIPEGARVEKVKETGDFQGVPIQIIDGKKIVDMPNGVRYRLDLRQVQYRDGTVKEEYVPAEITKPIKPQQAKPYPSEQEAMNLAAVEGAQSEGRIQQSAIFAKIVDAAQKAPDRESYIPQPPPRKR